MAKWEEETGKQSRKTKARPELCRRGKMTKKKNTKHLIVTPEFSVLRTAISYALTLPFSLQPIAFSLFFLLPIYTFPLFACPYGLVFTCTPTQLIVFQVRLVPLGSSLAQD